MLTILQELLGHSSIKTIIDSYVHVRTDSVEKAIKQFEKIEFWHKTLCANGAKIILEALNTLKIKEM